MHHLDTLALATSHQLHDRLARLARRRTAIAGDAHDDGVGDARDRGAVSLEQVLWFVAAGVSVAVIAAILWSQIRNTAETPVVDPQAP